MNFGLRSLVSDSDISANRFEAVKMTGVGFEVTNIAAATDKPIGILLNNPNAANLSCEVAGPGEVCKARMGGTVNAGDSLGCDADGELVAIVEGTDTTIYVIATALEDGVNQDVKYVLVQSPHRAA